MDEKDIKQVVQENSIEQLLDNMVKNNCTRKVINKNIYIKYEGVKEDTFTGKRQCFTIEKYIK